VVPSCRSPDSAPLNSIKKIEEEERQLVERWNAGKRGQWIEKKIRE
jgi:hypothetical protein